MNDSMNSTTAPGFVCEASDQKWTYLILMPLSVLAGLVNVVVWLAATFYRKKLLRQSYVYSCVTSTLLSNALFLSFHLWEEIDGYRMPEEMSKMPPGGKMQILWTLCTAAPVTMLFVMCGNLSVLIYVMLDSTHFQKSVHKRTRSTSTRSKSVATTKSLETKRRRAALLVAFSWLLPLVLTIAAVLTWNCADVCHCSPGARGEICPRDHGCSRTWMPMKNSFIAVNIALWFVEVASLIYVTVSGITNFQDYNARSVSTRTRTSTMSAGGVPGGNKKVVPRSPEGLKSVSSDITLNFDETDIMAKKLGTQKHQDDEGDNVFDSSGPNRRHFKINPRLRLVSLLSSVFVVGTILVPIAFFVDIGYPGDYNVVGIRIPSMVFVQVYTLLCPILLVKYMSNLKTALIRLASTVFFCFSK